MADYTKDQLMKILQDNFFEDPNVFKPGRRNDDAVDMCIIAHCLMLDPESVFADVVAAHESWSSYQIKAAEDHVDRVIPYLDGWGKEGTMEAMRFCINY
jgi:hypothetical protein